MNHTGAQVQTELAKIWPQLQFQTTSGEHMYWLLEDFFNSQQRHQYIESIRHSFPFSSSADWVRLLKFCSLEQFDYFLSTLSENTCTNLYDDKRGFYIHLISNAGHYHFSSEKLDKILSYIHAKFPEIVPRSFKLSLLRFNGAFDQKNVDFITLILIHLKGDLSRINLSIEELIECFSLGIGLIEYDKPQWQKIVKTYFIHLAVKLPYLFHSSAQIQAFYQQFAIKHQKTPALGKIVTFSSEEAKQEFDPSIQDCIDHIPNAYLLVSQYRPQADALMTLLIQSAIENPAYFNPCPIAKFSVKISPCADLISRLRAHYKFG